MAKQLNLIYALKDGKITNISEVERGLKCGCMCPACGEPLVARKGQKVMHHFAHYSGHNCEYGYESSLHLAAKAILSKAKKMMVPSVRVQFPDSYKTDETVSEEREIIIDHVELEKHFDNIVPDVVIYSGGKKFLVEIFVTHKIDEEKLAKIRKANISTIEVDLSKEDTTISSEGLAQILLHSSEKKIWKHNSVANEYLCRFIKAADFREIVQRGLASHVDNCPIAMRVWRGKPYANFIDDCLYCEFCISNDYNGGILCSGRKRIATIQDFNISETMRVQMSNKKIIDQREACVAEGRCPYCGGCLVTRQSAFGTFLGCKNYPHCRFTASIDQQTGEVNVT